MQNNNDNSTVPREFKDEIANTANAKMIMADCSKLPDDRVFQVLRDVTVSTYDRELGVYIYDIPHVEFVRELTPEEIRAVYSLTEDELQYILHKYHD